MAMVIKDGSASDSVYLVKYDEDQWKGYDKWGQDFCFEQWIKKAQPMGCKFVTLMLIPDPLFPSGTKEQPYIARTDRVESRETPAYNDTLEVQVRLSESLRYTDAVGMNILAEIRKKYAGFRGTVKILRQEAKTTEILLHRTL